MYAYIHECVYYVLHSCMRVKTKKIKKKLCMSCETCGTHDMYVHECYVFVKVRINSWPKRYELLPGYLE